MPQMKWGLCREGAEGTAAALPPQMSFEGGLLAGAAASSSARASAAPAAWGNAAAPLAACELGHTGGGGYYGLPGGYCIC